MREAVKALREKGLVEAYSGRGTFITDGTSQAARQSLDLMVKIGQPEGSPHLAEVRADSGAGNRRAGGEHEFRKRNVVTMREAVAVMDRAQKDPEAYIEADLDFHLALAEGAANPLILSLIDSIVGLLREQRHENFQRCRRTASADRFITSAFWMQSSGAIPRWRGARCALISNRCVRIRRFLPAASLRHAKQRCAEFQKFSA